MENDNPVDNPQEHTGRKHLSYPASLFLILRPLLVAVLLIGSFNAVIYRLPIRAAFDEALSTFYNLSSLSYVVLIMLAFGIIERFDQRNNSAKKPLEEKSLVPPVVVFFVFCLGSLTISNSLSLGIASITISHFFALATDAAFYSAWLFIVLTVLYSQKHEEHEHSIVSNPIFLGAMLCGLSRAFIKVLMLIVENYHSASAFVVPSPSEVWFFLSGTTLSNALFGIFVLTYFVMHNGKISKWFYIIAFLRIASFFIYPSDSFPFSSVVASIAFYAFLYAVGHHISEKRSVDTAAVST